MARQTNSRIVIPLSPGKNLLALLGAIALVVGCVFLWVLPNPANRTTLVLCRIVAVVGAIFFAACGVYAAIKMFDRQPGLIIDAKGLVDNSSGLAAGRIPWRDVLDVRVVVDEYGKYLVIDVRNPDVYIQRGNFLKRLLNASNTKSVGSPISIGSSILRINFDKLVDVIESAFERYTDRHVEDYDDEADFEEM